jgi:hypothetical protein
VTWLRLHLTAVLHALRVRRDLGRNRPLVPAAAPKRRSGPPGADVAATALLASRRAVSRLCPLDSCLSRSVVLYSLLASYEGVAIHYGFRRTDGAVEGHAWVTVDGVPVGERDGALDGYVETAMPPSAVAP